MPTGAGSDYFRLTFLPAHAIFHPTTVSDVGNDGVLLLVIRRRCVKCWRMPARESIYVWLKHKVNVLGLGLADENMAWFTPETAGE